MSAVLLVAVGPLPVRAAVIWFYKKYVHSIRVCSWNLIWKPALALNLI